MRTAIDTNVISAVWAGESPATAAMMALGEAELDGSLVICPVIYMELRAYPGATAGYVDGFLEKTHIAVDWNLDRAVWLLAADRFQRYAERRRGQERAEPKRVVADYLVGAHAALRADRLMTFDQRVFRTDFPEVRVTEP